MKDPVPAADRTPKSDGKKETTGPSSRKEKRDVVLLFFLTIMASTLPGRLGSFFMGLGLASLVGLKVVYDESQKSTETLVKATRTLEKRIEALEKKF